MAKKKYAEFEDLKIFSFPQCKGKLFVEVLEFIKMLKLLRGEE